MPSEKPPTQRMLATLRELAKPKSYALYVPRQFDQPAYFFTNRSNNRCTPQIIGLVARGLAEYSDGYERLDLKVRISANGRALLRKRTGVTE